MDRPAFEARGSFREVFASRFAFVLAMLGAVVLGVGILVGPVGAVLGIGSTWVLTWQWLRLRRLRLVVDAPGPAACLRHGRDGTQTVPLADVAGGVVHRTAGTTHRGMRTGADIERWLVVDHDGRALLHLDGRGFSAADLAAARSSIGGAWMSDHEALARRLLPDDAPRYMRRPRASATAALVAVPVTIAVLVGIGMLLAQVGTPAFVWPWW